MAGGPGRESYGSLIARRGDDGQAGVISAPRILTRSAVLAAATAILAAAVPGAASARRGGDDERVRVTGTCGAGAKSRLTLKARDGGIEAEFEIEHARRGSSWNVTFVQEGRVVWRGRARAGRTSGALEIERRLRDLAGADRVRVRAAGPRGVTCRAWATLPGA